MTSDWDMEIGHVQTRAARVLEYGGSLYGGIEPSAKTSNVFLYSDPKVGDTYGYQYDGWNEDGSVFLYTGEGTRGDQTMTAGNKAILEHEALDGRSLRLFISIGEKLAGTNTKLHRYAGEFTVDKEIPYTIEQSLDVEGEMRNVFVFRLRPLLAESVRPETVSPVAELLAPSTALQIPVEMNMKSSFTSSGAPPTEAERTESLLVERLIQFLEEKNCTLKRWKLKAGGPGGAVLYTDPYFIENKELFEVKSDSSRQSIRMAIGQLFDYRRFIPVEGLKLTILVPSRPSDDLINLIHGLDMDCIYENKEGRFTREPRPSSS